METRPDDLTTAYRKAKYGLISCFIPLICVLIGVVKQGSIRFNLYEYSRCRRPVLPCSKY
jgi:hypothetical protein